MELAADETREERGPHRTCIATRDVRPVEEMLRFVLGPDGEVVPDLRRKLPGRGVWVTATAAHVEEAVRRKAFQRAFKRNGVGAAPSLAETVDELMQADALQALAMANKAGAIVAGATKVEAAILAGRTAVLVHASDGSPDGMRKLDNLLHRIRGDAAAATPIIKLFSTAQLDLALGRTNVIHASLAGGGACEAFLTRCRRIDFYRSGAAEAPAKVQQTHGTGVTTVAAAGTLRGDERARPWDVTTHE